MASVLFTLPLCREVCLWSHCIDASRATAQYAIDRGHSIFVVPGGEREQVCCCTGIAGGVWTGDLEVAFEDALTRLPRCLNRAVVGECGWKGQIRRPRVLNDPHRGGDRLLTTSGILGSCEDRSERLRGDSGEARFAAAASPRGGRV